jgi:hypothetical protein
MGMSLCGEGKYGMPPYNCAAMDLFVFHTDDNSIALCIMDSIMGRSA